MEGFFVFKAIELKGYVSKIPLEDVLEVIKGLDG